MFRSTLIKNVLANFGGKVWSGLIQLVFVPLYIKFLGMEAFALIGFFIMIWNLLLVLDLGLSGTLNRELACRITNCNSKEIKDLVRTMEWIYWSIAIVIAAGIGVAAPWIAQSWVNVDVLPVQRVQHSIILMGLVAAAQWPYSLYSGGLMGLQKQVLLNTIRAFMATIQAGGAVLVLWLVSPSVEAYFMWQIGVVAIQTLLTCYFLWASLPKNDNAATFSWDLLGQCWRFAAGAAGISVATMLLAQVDKVILSKLLPLEQFGYYTLAFTIGNALMLLAIPISTALFPNLSELNARGKTEELSRIYHRGCQVVSLLVFPLGTLLALFPREILSLWTRNPGIVENTHLLLSLVSVGCALNAVITIPLILQLSHGWTSLSFYSNMISVVILIPLLFVLIPVLGAIGGAITWVLLNIGYVVFQIPLMHRRIIPKEMLDWYFIDVGLPVACCVVIGMIIKMILPETMTTLMKLSVLVTAFTGMSLACVLVIPSHRAYLAEHIHFH